MNIRIATAILLIFSLNGFAGKKPIEWKYAGEGHGIRFSFIDQTSKSGETIRLKVENTLSVPVRISFRVRDTDWSHRFELTIPAQNADSTHRFTPLQRMLVRYPFIDEVYVGSSESLVTGL